MWSAPVVWTVAGLALIVLEAVVPGLVLLFFGFGALVAALAAWLFDPPAAWQLLIFVAASLGSLALLRGRFAAVFRGREGAGAERVDGLESLLGETGVVSEAIAPGGRGRVKLRGSFYEATAREALPEGTPVRVAGDPRGDHSLLDVERTQ